MSSARAEGKLARVDSVGFSCGRVNSRVTTICGRFQLVQAAKNPLTEISRFDFRSKLCLCQTTQKTLLCMMPLPELV